MKPFDLREVTAFIDEQFEAYYTQQQELLTKVNLARLLLRHNPYWLRVKKLMLPQDLVEAVLDAHISSAEEGLFGKFLEELVLFVAGQTCNAKRSELRSIDMEFENRGVYYLVQIKSGTNWGNSSQQGKLAQDFDAAVQHIQTFNSAIRIQPVLGSCYGKKKTTTGRGYMRVAGQSFWYMISESETFYTDIIEPIGYRAQKHNEHFLEQRNRIIIKLTRDLMADFCDEDSINWERLVRFNSGNLDLR